MSEKDNVGILKRGYELWSESKGEASEYWFELMDDNVCWASTVDERSPGMEFAVDCQSKEGVVQYFETLAKTWEMENCHVEEYIAQGDRVVVLGSCKWKNRSTGKSVETKKVDVFRMSDGKIVDFREYYDTAKAIAAATE